MCGRLEILIIFAARRVVVGGIGFRCALYVRVANGVRCGGAPRPTGASYMKCYENSYETGRQGKLVCKREPCSNIIYNRASGVQGVYL